MDSDGGLQTSTESNHPPGKEATTSSRDIANVSTERVQREQWIKNYLECPPIHLQMADPEPRVIQIVRDETLDHNVIENRIAERISRLPHSPYIDGVCQDCWSLFQNWPEVGLGDFKLLRFLDTIALEATARKGCQFCSLLLQNLIHYDLLHVIRCIEVRLQEAFETIHGNLEPIEASMWIDTEGNDASSGELSFKLPGRAFKIDSPCCTCKWSLVETSDHANYRTLGTLELAKSWLNECTQDHAQCAERDSKTLPTRLVCVAGGDPYLISTRQWDSRPPYATLSHCWGGAQFLRLEKGNYEAFNETIPFLLLPKTFQDAVDITKALGLDYIWIDSLCIVQDDDDDWREEASLMSSVYGGSYINIAASSAASADQGCYMKVHGLVDGLLVKVHILNRDHEHKLIQFEQGALYNSAVWHTLLASRAWVFQEKILSPRTIHFGDRGVYWECVSRIASECLPRGLSHCNSNHSLSRQYREIQRNDYTAWWATAVEVYSAAKLTFGRDKLVAISGIARQIHERFAETYIAGLWRNAEVEKQLCWNVESSRRFGNLEPQLYPRPAYRAPSWSWASIDSAIEVDSFRALHYHHETFTYVRVLDARTYPIGGQDQFGQINAGWIRIACTGLLFGRGSSRKAVTVDCSRGRISLYIEPDTIEDADYIESHGGYILPLITRADTTEVALSRYCLGILLRPSGQTQGEFHRCGGFRIDSRLAGFSDLMEEIKQRGSPLARQMCAEVFEHAGEGEKLFVITIV